MKRFYCRLLLLTMAIAFCSCKAFMHGYTWAKAEHSYLPVTGNKNNFGDKRLRYNRAFHNHSALADFLNCKCNARGLPDFIYEYKTSQKKFGIKLFYVKTDSVYVFEQPKKNNPRSVLVEARNMNAAEQRSYKNILVAGKS